MSKNKSVYHYIDQRTDEWFEIRKKRLTASHAQAIAAAAAGLETYTTKVVAECFSDEDNPYTNDYMDNGTEREDEAILVYEFEKELKVDSIGFITYGDYAGGSPDGLVGKDGMIEIKRRKNTIFTGIVLTNKIDSGTVWQMQMNLLISGRKWCDFIAYNETFSNPLYVKRILADEKAFEKLEKGIEIGAKQIEEKYKAMYKHQNS